MKTFWKFSEETENCKDVENPCTFPGCENMSCEEYCSIDENCVNHWLLDKKCCECELCKGYDPKETTSKYIPTLYYSIPFSFLEVRTK